jgi:hypothetical protein
MRKLLVIIFIIVAVSNIALSATWGSSFSGSLTVNGANNYNVTFPGLGDLTITGSSTGSGGILVAYFIRSGTTVACKSVTGSASFSFDAIQVWPNETYTLKMYCPYGSVTCYNVALSLNYTPNDPPVISSITASPSVGEYGDPITVCVSATDPESNLSYIRLDYGGVSVTSNTSSLTHQYTGLAVGDYTVTAYAVDTLASSSDDTVDFSITRCPIVVKALGGRSAYGTTPSSQGLQLLSGTLPYGETISAIGLGVSQQITSITPIGTYTINVVGDPANYSVFRESGTWVVAAPTANGLLDADGDGIDDRLETKVYAATTHGSADFLSDTDGDGYLNFLDTSSTFSSSNTLSSRLPSGQGGPIIILPDRGVYEITVSNFVLINR